MSVSVNDSPGAIVPVTRGIFWDIISDRVAVLSYSISALGDDGGGKTLYTLTTAHDIQVGDVIENSGVSDDYYNVKQTVTDVTAVSVITDLDFGSSATGGTMERKNENFRIKAEVFKGDLDDNPITLGLNDGGNVKFTVTNTPTFAIGDSVAVSDSFVPYTSINSITDTQGKVVYDIGSHGIVEGAVVIVSGVTVDSSYNGTQRVIGVTGTTIQTDRDFVTGSGATAGQIDYLLYNGVHTVTNIVGNDVTTDSTFSLPTANGNLIEVSSVGSKFQQEVTIDGVNLFRINIANLIESTLGIDLATLTGGSAIISPNTASITNYTITLTEQFDGADGLRKDGLSIQTDVSKKGVNVALQHNQPQNLDIFTVNDSTKRFLTNMPTFNFFGDTDQDEYYKAGDVIQLHFIYTGSLQIEGRIEEYDDSFSLTTPVYTTGLADISIQRGILRVDTSTFQSDTTNFVVKLQDSASGVRSENFAFKLDSRCYPDARRIVWLNRLGGFDSFWFNKNLTENIQSNKTNYERGLGKNFSYSDRGMATLGSKSFEEFEVWSDWLNDGQKQWLKELFTSKFVYVIEEIEGQNEYIPIMLTDSRQVMRKTDQMTQLRLRYMIPELVING